MIKHIPYDSLGHHNYNWLDARYHFSFGRYFNPERMGFGALRVINDDRIKAGAGFETHPHDNMEIITYVRSGAITHTDSKGNKGRTGRGDVQVMSAGHGIYHSEYNLESEDTTLYQIWITPKVKDVDPQWAQQAFPKAPVENELALLVSGFKADKDKGALYIHQDARIYGGRLKKGQKISHHLHQQAYMLVANGQITLNEEKAINAGDGAEIKDLDHVNIHATEESEILIIEVPNVKH